MRNRTEYLGGSYVDAMPNGAFAVLFYTSHMETHLGRIELPPNDGPLYHRITTEGGFRIAGQAQASPSTWEWVSGAWRSLPSACGVSPVIYDLVGNLAISQCGPVGSQGYRFADHNRLWTGDETYSSSVGLSEWSMAGDLMIGQGHDGGGVKIWDGSTLRLLEDGDCRFIRVQVEGDAVAVSFRKPDRAVIVQTTMAELRALPVVSEPEPPVVPPVIPPVIPPVEPPMSIDYLAINKQVRALYPRAKPGSHPLGADHWMYLVDLAQRTGTLLFEKNDSNSVLIPSLGKTVSLDIVGRGTMGNTYADCLKDSEGVATPVWDVKSPADGAYIDVRGVVIPPTTEPPVIPPVQPPGTLPPGVYPIVYPPGYVPPKDLSDWIDHEFPILVQAHIKTQGFAPDYTWAAFQTCRRYGAGLPQGEPAWTFEKMLKHELGQS